MTATVSLDTWLETQASNDMLLLAWQRSGRHPLSAYEVHTLAAAALGPKTASRVNITMPSGHSRMPLLAAVHAAALQLAGFPSPFSPRQRGVVALATKRTVRRTELLDLDASGVPITPALRPVRQRQDGMVVPLHGGRPRPLELANKLLFIRDFSIPPPPTVVTLLVEGTDQNDVFLAAAEHWATRHAIDSIVVFDDITRYRPMPSSVPIAAGWSQALANGTPEDQEQARLRGHATVLDAGQFPELVKSAALLADARRRGELPAILVEASTLWRRLDELVVPINDYDAMCRRHNTATLSERITELSTVRAEDFPANWNQWAQSSWAGIKERLIRASENLAAHNTKGDLLVALIDQELRAGHNIDVALPSRTAREALQRHLDNAGVIRSFNGGLTMRSLRDVETGDPAPVTILISPPSAALRYRLTASDVGLLIVLAYRHEIANLRRALTKNLAEGAQTKQVLTFLPPALRVTIEARPSPEVLLLQPESVQSKRRLRSDVGTLARKIDLAALQALQSLEDHVDVELPDDDLNEQETEDVEQGRDATTGYAGKVVIYVRSRATEATKRLVLPGRKPVMRLLNRVAITISAQDLAEGMLVAGLDGPTPFQRLRPLLVEARGMGPRILMVAWECAVDAALERFAGPVGLHAAMVAKGSTVGTAAVAKWVDEDRLGPRNPADVARIGQLAGHPMVVDHATRIADVMRDLRVLHQAVGRLIGDVVTSDDEAIASLGQLIGDDAISILQEIVVYRVLAINKITTPGSRLASEPALPEVQPKDINDSQI